MKYISLFGICIALFQAGIAFGDHNWDAMGAWIVAALWALNVFCKDLAQEKETKSITENN